MDSLLNLMKSRATTRSFSEKPVPERILQLVVEAGMWAPSGAGIGGTKIIVVEDSPLKSKIRSICERMERDWVESQPVKVQEKIKSMPDFTQGMEYMEKAPLLLVVTTRPKDPEIPHAVESAFLAVGYMLVMIEGLGLGSLTYTPSLRDRDYRSGFADILQLPEGEEVQVILPLGFSGEPDTSKRKKELYNVYKDQYGSRIEFPEKK